MKKSLTAREKKVLVALLRYPELINRELGEKLGLSVSTVSAIKQRLLKEGFLRPKTWVNLQALGCKYLGTLHFKVHPTATQQHRTAAKEKILGLLKPQVSSFEETENTHFAHFRDYKEFHDKMTELKAFLGSIPYLLEEPKHSLIILDDTRFAKFDFPSLVEKILLEK